MRKVVVTGLGAISGNGHSVAEIWANLTAGRADRVKIHQFNIYDPKYAKSCSTEEGLIDVVCASPLTNKELFALTGITKGPLRYDRHQLFAILAVNEAVKHSKGALDFIEPDEVGIVGGTGDGGLMESHNAAVKLEGGGRLDPFSNLRELPNIFIGQIANMHGIKGPGLGLMTACAASGHGAQDAVRLIRLGEATVVVVVGTEAAVTQFGIASFAGQGALSKFSIPYQKGRKGFLMGEGAAALVLEDEEYAKKRGATILAEIAGYGATTDGNEGAQITDPDPDGGARAAKRALKMAGIEPSDIAYINTHGTGTPVGDKAELAGIKMWAGNRVGEIKLSSTKSFSGHLLGAAGAYELMLCVKMLQAGVVLPTHGLNEDNLDPEFADFAHVKGEPKVLGGSYILSNSFGFGGANSSIILKRP